MSLSSVVLPTLWTMARGRRDYTPEELLFQQALGFTIRRMRIEAGLNQDEFSVRARLERSYIPSLEAGKFDARISTLTRIANTLQIGIDELLRQVLQDIGEKPQEADPSPK